MFKTDLAIDFGTAQLKLCRGDQKILVNEPSVVSIDLAEDRVLAIGSKAYAQIGKTGAKTVVVSPMIRGTVADFDLAEYMVRYYLQQVREQSLVMPRAVATIPSVLTQVERRSLVDVMMGAGVRKICLIEEAMATAMGAGLDVTLPRGRLVANVGAGCTDIAVLSLGGISSAETLRVGGDQFDEEIIKFVRRKYNLVIGKKTAEQTKIAIGGVYPMKQLLSYRVKGQHARTGLPMWRDLTSDEVLEALLPPALQIARTIQRVLEDIPPDMLTDVMEDGIFLAGASAKLYGLDHLIARKTEMTVQVADEPEFCAVRGAGAALQYVKTMGNGSYGVLNPLHRG